MRQRFRASAAGLVLCVLAAFLAACSEPSAQIPVQEIAEEASVPRLTARTEGTDVKVAGTWSTDGLDVTYLVFPGVYQQLGGGAFYCYPDAAHYGDGVYSDCRKTSLKADVTEQRGKCEGGKKPPSRSIDTYF